jgi:hypothetical protein
LVCSLSSIRLNLIIHHCNINLTYKHIVSQSVKEVLDSLVADNLIQMDKIGTSNYFWSFPSAALVHVLYLINILYPCITFKYYLLVTSSLSE